MIQTDAGTAGNDSIADIRTIEAATEADLDHGKINLVFLKQQKRKRGREFKKSWFQVTIGVVLTFQIHLRYDGNKLVRAG